MFNYIEVMLRAGQVVAPPALLEPHIYERYLAPPAGDDVPLGSGAEDDGGGLEQLDPVCLMDGDPAPARWKTEYQGRSYSFCAPGCKKAFEREPTAYVS